MEVILREDVAKLGKAGEVVRVKPGYARNYLLPRGKAMPVNSGNLKSVEQQKKALEARAAKQKGLAQALAEKMATLTVTITREAGAQDKLFGAVTTRDISEALRKIEITVDKQAIVLAEPIKQLGTHPVPIKLYPDVVATLQVQVAKK